MLRISRPLWVGGLCATFANRAIATWNYLLTANRVGIDVREETLTENNLIEIQSRHPAEVRTEKFSPAREARESGADWEWWFGSRQGWIGVRVQSKKSGRNGRYRGLASRNRHGLQIDLLLNSSRKAKVHALYCFYNGWNGLPVHAGWNCPTYPPSVEMFGCAISLASEVRKLVARRRNGVLEVANISWPWSCLVCCPAPGSGRSLPERVNAFLLARDPVARERGVEVVTRPPQYVLSLLDQGSPSRRTRLNQDVPDFSHLLVVTEGL